MGIKPIIAPFEEFLDMKVLERKEGKSKVRLDYRKEFENPNNFMHGGVITSLSDTAMAVALSSIYRNSNFSTVKLEIEFKKHVNKETIIAYGRVIKKRKNFSFCDAIVKNKDDKIVAIANGTFFLHK